MSQFSRGIFAAIAVTVLVACEVELPSRPPANPLEIAEVGIFADAELPTEFAMGMGDLMAAARREAGEPVLE